MHSILLVFCIIYSAFATQQISVATRPDVTQAAQARMAKSCNLADGTIQYPLVRMQKNGKVKRRSGAGTAALQSIQDVTYNILVQVGENPALLALDTGSADLWVMSTCSDCCQRKNVPLYPLWTFQQTGLNATLLYGDSYTGTYALGIIGSAFIDIAGFTLNNQYLAVINDTNTSVVQTGSTGIFGLGFPLNSMLWDELYTAYITPASVSDLKKRTISNKIISTSQTMSPFSSQLFQETDSKGTRDLNMKENLLQSFVEFGPPISRLIMTSNQYSSRLVSPQISISLGHSIINGTREDGQITLGGLPVDVTNDSLNWIPVRRYSKEQNGVVVPQAPGEIYPYTWEVFLEDVYFDGVKLPRSILGDSNKVGLSALIDTGNSLIRGPSDVISTIFNLLTNKSRSINSAFGLVYPCDDAHILSFQFNGQRFDVGPQDFGRAVFNNGDQWCLPNLIETDPPELGGYLYSWSLGEPFLKGVLASFYYGNITHPSVDPPKVGFLSSTKFAGTSVIDATNTTTDYEASPTRDHYAASSTEPIDNDDTVDSGINGKSNGSRKHSQLVDDMQWIIYAGALLIGFYYTWRF